MEVKIVDININVNIRLSPSKEMAEWMENFAGVYFAMLGLKDGKPEYEKTAKAILAPKKPEPPKAELKGMPVSPKQEKEIHDILDAPEQGKTDNEAPLTEEKLVKVRPLVASFLKADKGHKHVLKDWLTAHGYERVTNVKKKDLHDLLGLIRKKEG